MAILGDGTMYLRRLYRTRRPRDRQWQQTIYTATHARRRRKQYLPPRVGVFGGTNGILQFSEANVLTGPNSLQVGAPSDITGAAIVTPTAS